MPQGGALRSGITLSCGCYKKEVTSSLAKHRLTGSVLYMRWAQMKYRCNDLTNKVYGAKGVSYDPRWEDFLSFYEDMSEGFSEDLELDRIDVTLGYYKENCRWVTHSENNYNKNIQSNNQSGKTGVSFHAQTQKYRAYITVNKNLIHLGLFENIEDAISARKSAELMYYGYGRP